MRITEANNYASIRMAYIWNIPNAHAHKILKTKKNNTFFLYRFGFKFTLSNDICFNLFKIVNKIIQSI